MKFLKRIIIPLASVFLTANASESSSGFTENNRIVVAYVTSWSDIIPNPHYMTHINYAFGHVAESLDSVRIDNPERLRQIVELKKEKANLKVLLSIGGWGSGRFSEMAADPKSRHEFALSCAHIVDRFGLDGIDIDWEYPGSDAAGISSSPDDPANFVRLMREIRDVLGTQKLLTFAAGADGTGCIFSDLMEYADFVNLMTYDMAKPPLHHSPLYKSSISGISVAESVERAIKAGAKAECITLGVPFYGRGVKPYKDFTDYRNISIVDEYYECFDSLSLAPYIADCQGNLAIGYDNVRSLKYKCTYSKDKGLKGIMYWDYAGDNDANELRTTIADEILGKKYPANYASEPRFNVLIYYNDKAEPAHVDFARQAIDYINRLSYGEGFTYEITTTLKNYGADILQKFDLMVAINAMPSDEQERQLFRNYMENGGGWVGFHAAAYNDINTGWPWFNEFLGAGQFYCNTWPPQPALIEIDTQDHEVTKNLPKSFVAPECEWYQWAPSPRLNPDVDVLLSLSQKNYPLGIKDIIYYGDFPIVWTNQRYRMIYLNIGHGDTEFTDPTQNLLFVNAFRWIASRSSKRPFQLK